jgi:SAM-dependent methyltransferase
MSEHFAAVAGRYRQVRTTDLEPVRYIRDRLAGHPSPRGADVGCGDGRYSLLLFRHLPGLHLTCIDGSRPMLEELSAFLAGNGVKGFDTAHRSDRALELEDGSFDFVCTFNAIHHFDLPVFLHQIRRALRDDGRLFIYTRTPQHNAEAIWGRYFPGFAERETRLLGESEMAAGIAGAGGLRLVATESYRYPRRATLERLLEQVRSRHYSTFSLYEPDALAGAIEEFEHALRKDFPDPDCIAWDDQNVMYEVARANGSPSQVAPAA